MAINVGTAVAYLTLDTTGYRDAIAAAGEMMRQFTQASSSMGESVAGLGAGAQTAGAEVKTWIAEITLDYQKLSEAFRAGQEADGAFFQGELDARAAAATAGAGALKDLYGKDQSNFQAAEVLKTQNMITELQRQEREVRLAQDANAAALKDYVPVWYSIGQEYGNMLLAGIVATRNQIMGYLDDIRDAVRAASSGQDFSIGAYAAGASGTRAGLAVVGEAGPEIVDFSGGERVLSFQRSAETLYGTAEAVNQAAGALAGVDYGNFYDFYAGTVSREPGSGGFDFDYRKLAEEIAGAVKPSMTYSPTYNSPAEMSVAEMRRADRISAERMGFGL
ncbi:MAG: hypothetical protein FWF44_02095 [Defluviitaleaceae bacterium]|nr:hypothetical protein [Defluviitaleaceae bacterium]